jgi:hypothetical protein
MAKAGYDASTEANVSLVATTAKTVLGVNAPAQFGVDLRGFLIGFDGVTNTDKPVLVEITQCTFATQPPGTASTSATVNQVYGRSIVAGFVAAYAWTTEPTVQVAIKTILLTPNGGTYDYDWPLGETFDNAISTGFGIRCTAPTSTVNVRATLRFERC